jgi:hypothetical protein
MEAVSLASFLAPLTLYLCAIVYLARGAQRYWWGVTVLNVWLAWMLAHLLSPYVTRFAIRLALHPSQAAIAGVDTYFVIGAAPTAVVRLGVLAVLPLVMAVSIVLGLLSRRWRPLAAA